MHGYKGILPAIGVLLYTHNLVVSQLVAFSAFFSKPFVVELRSATDSLAKLQEKMQEYLENGAQLGWLIDPQNQQVEIYRPGETVEVLKNPVELSGKDVLPGFILNLRRIWR